MAIRINYNRSVAFERSAMNFWRLGVENQFNARENFTLGSAEVH